MSPLARLVVWMLVVVQRPMPLQWASVQQERMIQQPLLYQPLVVQVEQQVVVQVVVHQEEQQEQVVVEVVVLRLQVAQRCQAQCPMALEPLL